MKTEMQKANSKYQKTINRLEAECTAQMAANTLRKIQIKQFNSFIKKLLQEGRITKEEIKEFIKNKDENKSVSTNL